LEVKYFDLSVRSETCRDHPLISILDILREGRFERVRVTVNEQYVPLDGLTKIASVLGYRVERVERLGNEIVMLEFVKTVT